MSITSEINEAKFDLDIISGEVERLLLLLTINIPNAEQVFDSLDTIRAKARKVRASL